MNSTNEEPLFFQNNIKNATLGSFGFLFVVGTVLNMATIGVILHFPRLRKKPFNLLLVYLATIDFISCLITAPANILMTAVFLYPYPVLFCRAVVVLHNFSGISSVTGMAEIAVLRVICILRNGQAYQSRFKYIIFTNIVVVTVFSFSRVLFVESNICRSLTSQKKVWLIINLSMISIFGVILCTTYAWIAWYTKTRARRILPERRAGRLPGDRYDIATIKTCVATVASFLLCYLPLFVYGLVVYSYSLPVHYSHYNLCVSFGMLCHVGNPVIIFCTSKDFRKHGITLYNKIFRRRVHRRIIPIDIPIDVVV